MVFITCILFFSSRYPGVPTDIQEENGIQYKFEVYEKSI